MDKLGEQIQRYVYAGFPILFIETVEEEKIMRTIREVTNRKNRLRIYEWSTWGHRVCKAKTGEFTSSDADRSLENVLSTYIKSVTDLHRSTVVIKDIYSYLDRPIIAGRLKYLAEQIVQEKIKDCTIILLSPVVKIPVELERYVAVLQVPELSDMEIENVIKDFCQEQRLGSIETDFMRKLIDGFKGLPECEIRNILALIYAENGDLAQENLAAIRDQKKQIVQKSGFLEMVEAEEKLDKTVGGLDNLKHWLKRKGNIIKNIGKAASFGVDMPRGVLIAGMPGCGKSLCAKATAMEFGIPLLRLDVGNLLGKYVGESEKNMQKALRLAEAISPCVLWIDELEKALVGIGGQGGNAEVTTRLLGTLLTWMQERKHLVFVVATTNKVDSIPPEFMRKGRFDDIFSVALPNKDERQSIFKIHIQKRLRKNPLTDDDIEELASKTYRFSGADIEGAVKDALEECFCNSKPLSMEALQEAVEQTTPLSQIMKEEVDAMQEFFDKRQFKNASE